MSSKWLSLLGYSNKTNCTIPFVSGLRTTYAAYCDFAILTTIMNVVMLLMMIVVIQSIYLFTYVLNGANVNYEVRENKTSKQNKTNTQRMR
jgi:hypothetical protein